MSAVTKMSEDIVVSGSDDDTLRVWNIKTGEEKKSLHTLEGHTECVWVVIKISEDIVVSTDMSEDGTLRVWRWKPELATDDPARSDGGGAEE